MPRLHAGWPGRLVAWTHISALRRRGMARAKGGPMKGRIAVVLVAVLCAGIALAAPASADVTDVSGSGAFGESVNVTVLGTGSVTSGPTPSVTLPSGGGGPVTDSLASVNLP